MAKAAASWLCAACASSTSAPVNCKASLHEAVQSDDGRDASRLVAGALNDAFLYVAWPVNVLAEDAHVS